MKFIEQFLEMMLAERGIAKNSMLSYKRDLKDFQEFLTKNRLTELEVKDSDISKFISELAKSGISPRSINRKISTLKSYFILDLASALTNDGITVVNTASTGRWKGT